MIRNDRIIDATSNIEHALDRAARAAKHDLEQFQDQLDRIARSHQSLAEQDLARSQVFRDERDYRIWIRKFNANWAEMKISPRYRIVVWKPVPPPGESPESNTKEK